MNKIWPSNFAVIISEEINIISLHSFKYLFLYAGSVFIA